MESLLAESRIPKMAVYGVQVGKIILFGNRWTKPDHKHQHDHIHIRSEKVCRRINYKKNTVEMALFQKYEVFY